MQPSHIGYRCYEDTLPNFPAIHTRDSDSQRTRTTFE